MAQNRATLAPFGSWKSPVTAEMVAASSNVYYEPKFSEDGTLFFLEMRPSEQGRYVLVRVSPRGQIEDVIPKNFNARDRVHEYGGGSYTVSKDGLTAFFSNFSDQRLYKIGTRNKDNLDPITQSSDFFYADYVLDERRNRLIGVQEDHSRAGEAVNTIVAISLGEGNKISVQISGNDFYSSPRISPNGDKLAWLTWNHPLLPFFGSELWIADISSDGNLLNKKLIAGGSNESVMEPRWSPGGVLYFVSDRSNWWNIYRLINGKIENILPVEAEFSQAHWVFGLTSYSFISEKKIFSAYLKDGFSHLALVDPDGGTMNEIKSPFNDVRYVESHGESAVLIGGSASTPMEVSLFSSGDYSFRRIYPVKREQTLDRSYLSLAVSIEYPTEGNQTAHGLYYAPKNDDYIGIQGALPPLIVNVHGGPTGRARPTLDLGIQYWTSRGFAVVDVNYGGSTGYGREYRMRLSRAWGVVDVDDCVSAALYLANEKLVDKDRFIIRGGSAGGYTTLTALALTKAFSAGASYFGISDLEVFVKDTHKFESRYLDTLVGPYPERRDVYRGRSALYHIDSVKAPVIFFQGLEDKIVPPNQAELMFDALKKKGVPTAYISYEGEQHGFRQAMNIIRSYEAELFFYSRVFKLDLLEKIEPVKIENL